MSTKKLINELKSYLHNVDNIQNISVRWEDEKLLFEVKGFKNKEDESQEVNFYNFAKYANLEDCELIFNLAKLIEVHKKWRNFEKLIISA